MRNACPERLKKKWSDSIAVLDWGEAVKPVVDIGILKRRPSGGKTLLSKVSCAVVLLGLLSLPVMGQEDARLRSIRERAFDASQRATSFQMKLCIRRSNGAVWRVRYLRDGEKYRIDREEIGFAIRDGEPVRAPYTSWSYDGEIYQSFNARQGNLKQSAKPQAKGAADPLRLPFRWVTSTLCIRDLAAIDQAEVWERLFQHGTYRGTRSLRGNCCHVVEFVQQCYGEPCLVRAFFSDAHDGFPVRYERRVQRTGRLSTLFSVDSWCQLKRPESSERIRLPRRMTHFENGADGLSLPLKTVVTIQPGPQINEPIDPASFDLQTEFETDSIYHVESQK